MQWEPVDVADLLRHGATSFSGQADAAGVALAVELPSPPASLLVTADYRRLDQVIGNLIANALRHTPAGGTITLRGRTAGDRVLMEVSDTGAGIAADELPYIFDRFWSRSSEGKAGTGLGLAIARSIVLAHGGVIEAESSVGDGTMVRVTLPAKRYSPVRD
jgi:two-component system sensor histidine kinase BaeS